MQIFKLLCLFLTSGSVLAAGAHSHGEGYLDVAAYGKKVEIHLKAPLADVIGFEHKAKNDKQDKAIKDAMNSLSKASAFISAGKSCKVKMTKMSGLKPLLKNDSKHEHHCEESAHHKSQCKDEEHKKHHDGHDDHGDKHEEHMAKCDDPEHKKHHDNECKHDKDANHHKGHHKKSGHGDFEAEYQVECKDALKGKTLELKLKKVLPRLKKLRVQFVGGSKPVGGVKNVTDSMRFEL